MRGRWCSRPLLVAGVVPTQRLLCSPHEPCAAACWRDQVLRPTVGRGSETLRVWPIFIGQAFRHCNLKPENILVGSGMRVKISDFGLAEDSSVVRYDSANEQYPWVAITAYMTNPKSLCGNLALCFCSTVYSANGWLELPGFEHRRSWRTGYTPTRSTCSPSASDLIWCLLDHGPISPLGK